MIIHFSNELCFCERKMSNNPNYNLDESNDLDFDDEGSSDISSNNVADFELSTEAANAKYSKSSNKRNFEAKRKIEQLQEKRRLQKLDENYYDDWD